MKLIKITNPLLSKAKTLAEEMGTLKGSFTKGQGNIVGFVGELAAAKYLKADHNATYDYDMIHNGKFIDVKSKGCGSKPKEHYECSVSNWNTKQKCDLYVFTRVLRDYSKAWLLGFIEKKKFFDLATFVKRGTVDKSNGFVARTDHYSTPISDLEPIEKLLNNNKQTK